MDANRVTRGLALTSLLLGVGNLLLVGYSIATYEAPPDDGGTSFVGLIWVIYMVLAGLGVTTFQVGTQVGYKILEGTPLTIGRVFVLAVSGNALIGLGAAVQFLGRYLE